MSKVNVTHQEISDYIKNQIKELKLVRRNLKSVLRVSKNDLSLSQDERISISTMIDRLSKKEKVQNDYLKIAN